MAPSRTLLPLACGALALLAIGCGPLAPLFVAGEPIASGPGGGEVVLADVDGDGHTDVLAKFLLRRLIAIHFGTGDGGFGGRTPGAVSLAYEPGAMAAGDLNGDGRLDLAVASRESDREAIHVLLGDGRGAFAEDSPVPYAVPGSATGYKPIVRIVDIDLDGQPDVVVANGRRNSLHLFSGDGHGLLDEPVEVTLEPGHDFYTFDVADMDRDGRLDLVYAASLAGRGEDRLTIRAGDGRRAFGDPQRSATVPAEARLAGLEDIDGDGRTDVVVGHGEARRMSLLLNHADGRMSHASGSPWEMTGNVLAAVVRDVDADGRADLIAATAESVSVLLGDGQGWTAARGSPFPTGRGTYNLAVGDVNRDGQPDIVATGFEADTISVLLSR